MVLEILDGNEMYVDSKRASVRTKAVSPQLISTAKSRGQILFNNGAIGRINRDSQMRLGKSCFFLQKGEILVSGKQNGCTQSARLSVRGTSYILTINDSGDTEVTALEGLVDIETGDISLDRIKERTSLKSGQRLLISPAGIILEALMLTPEALSDIANGPLFEGFLAEPPRLEQLKQLLQNTAPQVTPLLQKIPRTIPLPTYSPIRLPLLTL